MAEAAEAIGKEGTAVARDPGYEEVNKGAEDEDDEKEEEEGPPAATTAAATASSMELCEDAEAAGPEDSALMVAAACTRAWSPCASPWRVPCRKLSTNGLRSTGVLGVKMDVISLGWRQTVMSGDFHTAAEWVLRDGSWRRSESRYIGTGLTEKASTGRERVNP